MKKRSDHEEPEVISRAGWKYHHIGIPTTLPHPEEKHLKKLKMYVRGFDTSPYGIEWMRFEPGCKVHELIRTLPHIAFEVDNLEEALEGRTILSEINSPSKGVRVAMIIDDGVPIELIEFNGHIKRSKIGD